jgi:hypothetical protein
LVKIIIGYIINHIGSKIVSNSFYKQQDMGFGVAALHSLEAIMCHKFLSLIVLAYLKNMKDFRVLWLLHKVNKAFCTLIFNLRFLIVVEIKNAAFSSVFEQLKVTKARKHDS